jgi:DNA-binding transcriptional ArsR family regulator/2-polyprenyl-3-methyl-5-hydroxy-6-metoxy-1,4-benzoquinol methylase
MSLELATLTLKAAADPTRLRLLALLARGEASVGELQRVLDQSQPRVSRHLRLLTEAGLVERFREGHWVFYRLASGEQPAALWTGIRAVLDPDDAGLRADAEAFAGVQRERQRDAFTQRAQWLGMPQARPGPDALRDALEDCLADRLLEDALDVGCGAGSLLAPLAARAQRVIGVDVARVMRNLARSRIAETALANCSIRDADLHALPFADDAFDCVVLDEVLGASATPGQGLDEAARVLRPGGRLLILDRIEPAAIRLRRAAAIEAGLIENQLGTWLAERGLQLHTRYWFPGPSLAYALFSADRAPGLARTGTLD